MPPSPPATKAKPGSGKKILGMNRTTVIVVGVAFAAAIGYFLWTRYKAAQAAAAPAATTATGCTDSNNNPVPCPEQTGGLDEAGELSVIQTELEGLLASQGTGTTTTTSTGTTTGTTTKLAAPAGLKATGGKGTVTASWSPVSGAANYQLLITGAGGTGTGTSHSQTTHTGTSATVTGLKQGQYKVQVAAWGGTSGNAANGPWSSPVTVKVTS